MFEDLVRALMAGNGGMRIAVIGNTVQFNYSHAGEIFQQVYELGPDAAVQIADKLGGLGE